MCQAGKEDSTATAWRIGLPLIDQCASLVAIPRMTDLLMQAFRRSIVAQRELTLGGF